MYDTPKASDFVAFKGDSQLGHNDDGGLKARWLAAKTLSTLGLTNTMHALSLHAPMVDLACKTASEATGLRVELADGWLKNRIDGKRA